MKKFVIICRGIPGSGKTTWAFRCRKKLMCLMDLIDGTDYWNRMVVVSADDYWVRKDNVYDFNPKLLSNAHAYCFNGFKKALRDHHRFIFVDNTNIKRKDFQKYVELAVEHGYTVREKTVGKFDAESLKLYAERNIHGVPLETIERMARKFEI